VVIILRDSAAKNCGTHWVGPIDFVVEIVSRGDRSRRKLPFYSKIGVRELLLVDRQPWRLRLYRHNGKSLELVGECDAESAASLASEVVPFSFGLASADPRPTLLLVHQTDGRTWQA
jgi:Uma2 family endonuclease